MDPGGRWSAWRTDESSVGSCAPYLLGRSSRHKAATVHHGGLKRCRCSVARLWTRREPPPFGSARRGIQAVGLGSRPEAGRRGRRARRRRHHGRPGQSTWLASPSCRRSRLSAVRDCSGAGETSRGTTQGQGLLEGEPIGLQGQRGRTTAPFEAWVPREDAHRCHGPDAVGRKPQCLGVRAPPFPAEKSRRSADTCERREVCHVRDRVPGHLRLGA